MRKHLNIPRTNAQTRSPAIAARAQSKGHSVAQVLAGSWRLSPSRLHLSTEELAEAIPLLLRCGSAALGWRRVRRSDPQTCAAGQELQQAYRLHTIQSALHEQQLKDVFRRTRAAGIEPLLWKGWAVARLYPEPGLRPYGDIDLLVSPRELEPAELALRSRTGRLYCVELHTSLYKQYERTPDDVLAHSRSVLLDDVPIRVPSEEDHLRYLCLHFLHHGAWRPLWLCDIALAVESRHAAFDWDRCLGGKGKHADWVACAVGLAYQLLGADVSGTPVVDRAKHLPQWLVPAVLRQWGAGRGMSFAESLAFSLTHYIWQPPKLLRALRDHWRNPVQASVEMSATFDELPRGPFQLGAALLRVPRLTKQVGRQLRRTN